MTNAVATPQDVADELDKPLTPTDAAKAQRRLDGLVATLETWLNRTFGPTPILGEVHNLPVDGALTLWKGPVISVERIILDGTAYTDPVGLGYWESWPWAGSVAVVDYTAGEPAPAQVRELVINTVAASFNTPVQVAAGVITSYAVEGASITYGPTTSAGANTGGVGRVAVADLRSIARLRRRVTVH